MQHYQIIIIGAGAAGLLASIRAAELGQHVLLLEKTPRAGTKILMSGGTRCNITHDTDRRGIVTAFGKPGKFLHSALASLSPQDVLDLFHAEGVKTKVEPGGKIFPVSDKATDVLQALLKRLRRSNCELALSEPVLTVKRTEDQNSQQGNFIVQTDHRQIACDRLIVTTGGKSYPGSGTTGDGYAWLEQLGHRILPTRPALTPITSDTEWIRGLKGLTLEDVQLQVVDAAGRRLDTRRGGFLFTHFGMSGPVALDISRNISGHERPRDLTLVADFFPQTNVDAFAAQLRAACEAAGAKNLSNVLSQLVPRRLAEAALNQSGVEAELRAAELPKASRKSLIRVLKENAISISGTRGYKKAEVTAGGVDLKQVDSKTMQSRVCPHLFIAGEILDLDGPIGGYNFQAAFSTAWLAGTSAAEMEFSGHS